MQRHRRIHSHATLRPACARVGLSLHATAAGGVLHAPRAGLSIRNEYTKLIYSYARPGPLPTGKDVSCVLCGGLTQENAPSPLASHIIFGAPLSRDRRINTDLSHL